MVLQVLTDAFTVCKLAGETAIDFSRPFCFAARTDEELSLVCRTQDAPDMCLERSDGWRALRVQGVLAFSLTGVLARLTAVLAKERIAIFAVSTYNTDYILTKAEDFDRAVGSLAKAGYGICLEHGAPMLSSKSETMRRRTCIR